MPVYPLDGGCGPQRAPVILSVNEVKRLLAVARPLKAKVLLSIAYGTGMRAGEVVRLKVGDIDGDQMIIRIIQAMLGHSKLDVTARYTQVATKMIAKVENPLDLLAPTPRKGTKDRVPEPA